MTKFDNLQSRMDSSFSPSLTNLEKQMPQNYMTYNMNKIPMKQSKLQKTLSQSGFDKTSKQDVLNKEKYQEKVEKLT